MLSLFPGRTLEEIDEIDYARLNRALAAKHIERVLGEALKGDAKRLSSDDWELVRNLDELDRRYYG